MTVASCELENQLFKNVYAKTPDYIRELNLIDFNIKEEFSFLLRKEYLEPYDAEKNPQGLGLKEWFENYAKEARVSTAGIRGPQNILFPQDTRFPINLIGLTIVTLAKILVAKEKYPNKKIVKIAGREVRYNSADYLEAITRLQAINGITTIVPVDKKTIPIWMASFLAFKLDLLGGEYITSSHGISVKNATKDLNNQGSQYLPEESLEFINKVQEIFDQTEKNGYYPIDFSSVYHDNIDQDVMKKLNDGVDPYVEYLKTGVAKEPVIDAIKNNKGKIVIDNVGGCAYRTLSRVLEKLEIADKFDWIHVKEDPFFHGIGKYNKTPKGENAFYDYSVDATVVAKKPDGKKFLPVIESMDYENNVRNYAMGTTVLITDPDHDRLTIAQKERIGNMESFDAQGIDYVQVDPRTIFAIFSANQAFLMLMDFWAKQLKELKLWKKHPRFIIKTTASSKAWDEWAAKNGVKVINVPVGFKEIANVLKKIELKIKNNPEENIIVEDVFGNPINLGKNPRLLFAGEESGGMIMGPDELIESIHGRKALAMREKSATEAIIVASAMAAKLGKTTLAQHLAKILKENEITSQFDTRVDIAYYNESEPDIEKMKEEKRLGEEKRTNNDLFYLSMAIAVKEGLITLENVKEILADTFKELDFSNLQSIRFVGDGTYLDFTDKYLEIRPSGTDAKTKAYCGGIDKENIEIYAGTLGYYSGERTELHKKFIPTEFYENAKETALNYYLEFVAKDANNEKFEIPDYTELFK